MKTSRLNTIKKYTVWFTTVMLLAQGGFLQFLTADAATYTYTQSDWTGGVSSTATSLHPGNDTNWTKYSSSTTETIYNTKPIISTTSLTIFTQSFASPTITTTTQTDNGTTNTGFKLTGYATSSADVTGTGDSASVKLTTAGLTWTTSTLVSAAHGIGNFSHYDKAIAIGSDGFARITYGDGYRTRFTQCLNASCSMSTTSVALPNDDFNSSAYTGLGLALNASNLASIARYHGSFEDIQLYSCTTASCSSFTSTTLDQSVGSHGFNDFQGPSIALEASGTPMIAYYNATSQDINFTHCANATCTTQTSTTIESSGTIGFWPSIAIGTDGLPRIAYLDYTNNKIKLTKCGNVNCTAGNVSSTVTAVIGASGGNGRFAMALASDNTPRIFWADGSNPYPVKFIPCTNDSCGTVGTTVTLEANDYSAGYGFGGIALYNDNPRMTYFDFTNNVTNYLACTTTTCSNYTTSTIENNARDTQIAVTSDGLARITVGNRPTGALLYDYQTATYNSSGVFTSGPIDTATTTTFWGNLSLASTTAANTTITLKARTSSSTTFITAFSSCSSITNGATLTSGGCVTNGDRYIQYQASLATTDTSVTPSLDSVSITYTTAGYVDATNSTANWNVLNGNFETSPSNGTTFITTSTLSSSYGYATDIAIGSDNKARIVAMGGSERPYLLVCNNSSTCSSFSVTKQLSSTISVYSFHTVSIGLDSSDRPIVAAYDVTNADLHIFSCDDASCTNVTDTTVDSTGDVGNTPSLAVGSDGYARISYYDTTNTDLKYIQCTNWTCSTKNTTSVDTAGTRGYGTSLVLGTDGYARISYYNNTNSKIMMAQCTNGACTSVTTSTVDSAAYPSSSRWFTGIALGSDGYPRILYWDHSSQRTYLDICSTASCSATSSNATITSISGGAPLPPDLTLTSGNLPRMILRDGDYNSTYYKKCTTTTCSSSSTVIIDSGTAYRPGIAIRNNLIKLSSGGSTLSYGYESASSTGQSLTLDTVSQSIPFATLTKSDTPGTGSVTYYLSNNGGANWTTATAGTQINFSTIGSDLRFKFTVTGDATVSSVTVTYDYYNASGQLIGSPHNSNDSTNIISSVGWIEDATAPAGTTNKVSYKMATSSASLADVSWTQFSSSTTGCTFSSGTVSCGASALPASWKTSGTNQWFQYKIDGTSADGMYTPTVTSVSVVFVVNAAPDFDQTFGTGGLAVSQDATSTDADFGKVKIRYSVRDVDTNTGTTDPNYVTPSFEYRLNSGDTWHSIATSTEMTAGDGLHQSVATSSYSTYTATWSATTTLGLTTYSTTTQIRVTVDDREGANNTTSSISAAFTLDTKTPTITSLVLSIPTSTITLAASDDSNLQYRVSSTPFSSGSTDVWTSVGGISTSTTFSYSFASTTYPTVYVQARDVIGNTTSTTVSAPYIPANFQFKDVSNVPTSNYGEFVTWEAYNPTSTALFGSYKIYRSTDGTNYSLLTTVNTSTTNYYYDQGLSSLQTYYYKANTLTSNGDQSAYTSPVSDIPNGQGGSDTTAPVITAVATSTATSNSIIVTWTTDEVANTEVDYSISPSTAFGSVASSSGFVTGHSLTVTGLAASTTYLFRVKSADPSGNSVPVANGGGGYVFTTAAAPVISAVATSSVANTGATVTWTTDVAADSYVVYSTSSSMTPGTQTGTSTLITSHSVALTGLATSTTYYFYVKSTDSPGTLSTSTVATFQTTSDTTAPVISSVATALTTSSTVVITWTTDELATSQVFYGLVSSSTSPYTGSTTLDSTLTINHSVTASNLTASTTYYYQVRSQDASANLRSSNEATFLTVPSQTDLTAPVISAIASSTTSNSATVTWTTNEPANSEVDYSVSPSTAFGSVASSSAYDTAHSVTIMGLTASTTYLFRVKSADPSTNVTTDNNGGAGYPFRTTVAPAVSSVATSSVGYTTSTITWTSNVVSDSYVYYSTASNMAGAVRTGTSTLTTSHTLDLSGLATSTAYYFYVQSSDAAGSTASSSVVTFQTGSDTVAPVISSVSAPVKASTTASIAWTTDELSTSQVIYGTASGSYPSSSTLDSTITINHSVSLTGLTASTTYYYKVKSQDAFGNLASSSEQSFASGPSGIDTTPPVISAITVATTTSNSARITWTTSELANAEVDYSISPSTAFGSSGSVTSYGTSQSITLSGLTASTTYLFQVKSVDTSGNSTTDSNLGAGYSFNTLGNPTPTSIATSSISDTGATVTWTTSVTADSYVTYSTSSSLTPVSPTTGTSTLVTSHSVTLTGLATSTTYYFYVKSTDLGGTAASSSIYTFRTTSDTTAPVISSVAAPSSASSTAVITWNTDELATSQVYYGTASTSLSSSTSLDATLTIKHAVTLTGLATSTTYYFAVYSNDAYANAASSSVSSFTSGIAVDTTTPAISSVAATSTSATVTVTWTTSELTKAEVQYATSTTAFNLSAVNSNYATSTSVAITGLTASTTYYYRVKATDISNNSSTDANGGTGYYAITTRGGPTISSVVAVPGNTSAAITWSTNLPADSSVVYSTSSGFVGYVTVTSSAALSTSHSIDLTGLTAATTYYYYVQSTDSNSVLSTDNNNGSYYSFLTTHGSAPTISNILVPVKTSTAAVVTWNTDILSTSQVFYGTAQASTTPYTLQSTIDSTMTIAHVVTLSGLTADATYYFKVQSIDTFSNIATSDEQNFKAAASNTIIVQSSAGGSPPPPPKDTTPPVITEIKIDQLAAFGASITFTTNEPSTGFVSFGETDKYGFTSADPIFNSQKHTIILTGLRLGTEYHFQVQAMDKEGNFATSPDQTFKTKFFAESLKDIQQVENAGSAQSLIESSIESFLPSFVPPFIEKPRVSDISENQATITWKTNTNAYGIVAYAPDDFYGTASSTSSSTEANPYTSETSDLQTKTQDHKLILSGLRSNTRYHYMVKSFTLPQVVGKSDDLTFITKTGTARPRIAQTLNNGFRIVWTTDEPASSIVTYKNLKTGETNQKTDPQKSTDHDILIDNLTPATSYELTVSGYNEKDNPVQSGEAIVARTSQDVTPPVISNIKIDNALVPGRNDRVQTVVSWRTDEPANSLVLYQDGTSGAKAEFKQIGIPLSYSTDHNIIITDLKPGQLYRVRIESVDQAGNKVQSPIRTIITPRQSESIVDIVIKNFEETFNFLQKIR